jgi:hypothetical protein
VAALSLQNCICAASSLQGQVFGNFLGFVLKNKLVTGASTPERGTFAAELLAIAVAVTAEW